MNFDWLSDPENPRFKFGMTKRCGLCGAAPNEKCRPPIFGRLIHLDRTHGYKAWEEA